MGFFDSLFGYDMTPHFSQKCVLIKWHTIFFTDKEFIHEEDAFYVKGASHSILRSDVARYMLKTMEEELHQKKIVAIATK